MRFDVVGELTAHVTPAGTIALRPVRRARVPQRWTGVARTARLRVPLEYGFARLEVFRGEVIVEGISEGSRSSNSFVGPARYLAASRYLQQLRRDAAQWVESERQLARIAR